MSGRARPSARKKTLYNVKISALSVTDKKCIEEVFEKYEQQKAEIEELKKSRDRWREIAEIFDKAIKEAEKEGD